MVERRRPGCGDQELFPDPALLSLAMTCPDRFDSGTGAQGSGRSEDRNLFAIPKEMLVGLAAPEPV